MKYLLLLLLVFSSIMRIDCKLTGIFSYTVTVGLVNLLDSGADLTIHCKEKNNDLGYVTLKFKERYSFSFKINNIARNKLFFCSFQWSSSGPLLYFDVYVRSRDTCEFCLWNIEEKGPCNIKGDCTVWNGKSQSTFGMVTPNNTVDSTSNLITK